MTLRYLGNHRTGVSYAGQTGFGEQSDVLSSLDGIQVAANLLMCRMLV